MTTPFPSRRPVASLACVLDTLESIVEWSCVAAHPIGYFGAIYSAMTREIAEEISEGTTFEDGERMERFGVIFANRYLEAVWRFRGDEPIGALAWQVAFEATERDDITILQHLLLGINAHIRLDLCVAAVMAAQAEGSTALQPLKRDFDRVNDVLEEQIPRFHDAVLELSPGLGPFEWFSWQERAGLAILSAVLRERAWDRAQEMLDVDETKRKIAVAEWDAEVAGLGHSVLDDWFGRAARTLLSRESRDVGENIRRLR